MTELVLDTDLTVEQRDFLSIVKSSADSLLAIINDILDFSKIEAGRLELDPVCFSLRDNIYDAVRALALRAHEKGLEFVCEWKPEVPDYVLGDPVRLRQVIVNLLGNAIKFTETGEVALEIAVEKTTRQDVELHFVIRDTGIGIAPDKQGLIFEAFSQADGSMTRRFGGTGLGLTISARLVEAMNGRIWVESTPGQGSSFHFIAQFANVQRVTPAEDQPFLKDLSILVVDDNVTNRRVLSDMLWRWGMKPVCAATGSEAIALARRASESKYPFPLMITDIHMPQMDGFQLVEKLAQLREGLGLKILMLTSGERAGDKDRARKLGVAACLLKPVRREELRDVIAKVLGQPIRSEHDGSAKRSSKQSDREDAHSVPSRILLAEDNAVNQLLLQSVLEKDGHNVKVVGNGREAIQALGKERFDMVFMDVQMPIMDGLEAARAVRDSEAVTKEHVPIVALTAHAMKGDQERCLAAGMDAYLSKPTPAADLLAMVRAYGRKEEKLPEPTGVGVEL